MKIADPQHDMVVIGFDSAWTDNPKSPGAICAISFDGNGRSVFHEPELANFCEAIMFINKICSGRNLSLVAIDQPTIVPNCKGSRPVDRIAASVVSFVGGGVQPANRCKLNGRMFGDEAPIWKFISELGAVLDPLRAREAKTGNFLIEVFPALALPSLEQDFYVHRGGPKYNPKNKKFRPDDWCRVVRTVQKTAEKLGVCCMIEWASRMQHEIKSPKKSDQDKLDASICALIGLHWLLAPEADSLMIGDLENGYMITPVTDDTRERLKQATEKQKQKQKQATQRPAS